MQRGLRPSLPRAAALVALGELAVHQLRYLLAYGGNSGRELAAQGHSYLDSALPVLCVLALAVLAGGVLRAALDAGPGSPSCSIRRGAAFFAVAIAAVFAAQELIEGALAAGHPGGPAAVLAHGGLVALPLSILLGAACAVLYRGFVRLGVLLAAALSVRARLPRAPRRARAAGPVFLLAPAASPLAFGLARRPPPSPFAG